LLHDDTFDVLDLTKPEINIGYGGYYLDKLLRYYGGNPYLAAAAYNGGPLNVNQWLEACGSCSSDEFVEAIPFRETRRYVRQVMTNLAQYGRIYAGKMTLPSLPRLPKHLPDGEEIF
jgi:soluble lytic murein transglycosylase